MKLVYVVAFLVLLAYAMPARAQGVPTGTPHQVTLTWNAPSPVGGSGTIKQYKVYRSPAGPPSYTLVGTTADANTRTIVDNTVMGGTTYGYCATTIDTASQESACTIPVTANVPNNPNPPQALTATGS
jgi:fibronectin type 3 domain-containing protein